MKVNEKGIIVDIGYITLTPKEVLDLIRELREALFAWSKLTGKRIDSPECY